MGTQLRILPRKADSDFVLSPMQRSALAAVGTSRDGMETYESVLGGNAATEVSCDVGVNFSHCFHDDDIDGDETLIFSSERAERCRTNRSFPSATTEKRDADNVDEIDGDETLIFSSERAERCGSVDLLQGRQRKEAMAK